MGSAYVPRSKDAKAKLTDNRPTVGATGALVRLTCGCTLMHPPEITSPQQKWWCDLHHGWQTVPR